MIVRQFLSWVRTASATERAEATRALARAWLISDMSEEDRVAAEGALLMLLDDASPLVREAMADVFAASDEAPPAIVRALAADQTAVALPILEHSPLLIDADLVDLVATGDAELQCAVARRVALPVSVSAAIAEVGGAEACLELIENSTAEVASISIERIVARHGHLAAIREALLERADLPASIRLALAELLSQTLSRFVVARNWMSADRADRMTSEVRERGVICAAADSRGTSLAGLVNHLRETSQLTPGLILRALLSGNTELFTHALVELSGLTLGRVIALTQERGGAGLTALLTRAGFPASTIPAFRAAVAAMHELGFAGSAGELTQLRRTMVERVLTQCEGCRTPEMEPLLILLRRFAVESAREEARMLCEDLAMEDARVDFINNVEAEDHALAA
jgi:uncharacterized protein (DUF2336 family)